MGLAVCVQPLQQAVVIHDLIDEVDQLFPGDPRRLLHPGNQR